MWARSLVRQPVRGCLVGEGRSLSPALRREHFKAPSSTFMLAGGLPPCVCAVSTPDTALDMEGEQPPSAPRARDTGWPPHPGSGGAASSLLACRLHSRTTRATCATPPGCLGHRRVQEHGGAGWGGSANLRGATGGVKPGGLGAQSRHGESCDDVVPSVE